MHDFLCLDPENRWVFSPCIIAETKFAQIPVHFQIFPPFTVLAEIKVLLLETSISVHRR